MTNAEILESKTVDNHHVVTSPMQIVDPTWFGFHSILQVFRQPVPGGWVVTTVVRESTEMSSSSVFVADPDHAWDVREQEPQS
jgi:hypothetical protein